MHKKLWIAQAIFSNSMVCYFAFGLPLLLHYVILLPHVLLRSYTEYYAINIHLFYSYIVLDCCITVIPFLFLNYSILQSNAVLCMRSALWIYILMKWMSRLLMAISYYTTSTMCSNYKVIPFQGILNLKKFSDQNF